MAKNVAILALLGLLVWFGSTIIRLESYHSASQVGMCSDFSSAQLIERDQCLNAAETRTSGFWHLMYALGIF